MTLEETTQLYASVLRQLLPTGGYDTSPNTEALAVDVYAHAKLLAQADLDAKRLLKVLEGFPPDLISEYETEYGLPLKCTVNAGKTLEERIELLKWVRSTRNVLNKAYLKQILAFFGVFLLDIKKHKPLQCTEACTSAVNTERSRFKVQIIVPESSPADINCIIDNYLPGYLKIEVVKMPPFFKTTKPYPYYFQNAIKTEFKVDEDVSQRMVMHNAETAESTELSVSLSGATVESHLTGIAFSQENVGLSFGLKTATQRSVLLNIQTEQENLASAFAIASVNIKKALITHNNDDVEKVSTSFGLTSVHIL